MYRCIIFSFIFFLKIKIKMCVFLVHSSCIDLVLVTLHCSFFFCSCHGSLFLFSFFFFWSFFLYWYRSFFYFVSFLFLKIMKHHWWSWKILISKHWTTLLWQSFFFLHLDSTCTSCNWYCGIRGWPRRTIECVDPTNLEELKKLF